VSSPQPPRLSARALGERLGVSGREVLRMWDELGPLFANWCLAGKSRRHRTKRPDPEGLRWVRSFDGNFYPAVEREPGSDEQVE